MVLAALVNDSNRDNFMRYVSNLAELLAFFCARMLVQVSVLLIYVDYVASLCIIYETRGDSKQKKLPSACRLINDIKIY